MNKNQKIQILCTLCMISLLVGACVFGAKFLMDTIYLFLVQESVAADITLIKLILGYISTYHLLHFIFIGIASLCIIISGIVLYKDRTYKIAIFIILMSVTTLILVFMNKGLINLMNQAKEIISVTTDFTSFFELGKDFISISSKITETLPATATNIAVKSLVFDIATLSIFLLMSIVLTLRLIDLRRYRKE